MSSYYYAYGDGAYRSGYSRTVYGNYYHSYTDANPANGYYHHYYSSSGNGIEHSGYVESGYGSYRRGNTYDNASSGYYRHESFSAEFSGGEVYQSYYSHTDIPAYHHNLYIDQDISGAHASGYKVYIAGAEISTYSYNNLSPYGYVRGQSYAYGYGNGEELTGSRITDDNGYISNFDYSGYRPFGYHV